MIKRIHVNQHNIRANAKQEGEILPVLTVKTSKGNFKGNRVTIDGPSELVYQPEDPLDCGAKVWIITHSKIIIEDACGESITLL